MEGLPDLGVVPDPCRRMHTNFIVTILEGTPCRKINENFSPKITQIETEYVIKKSSYSL